MDRRAQSFWRISCLALCALASAFLLSGLSDQCAAADDDRGVCGDGAEYQFTGITGEMRIVKTEGVGEMDDYDTDPQSVPWNGYKEDIRSVIVESGITHIGNYAFSQCHGLLFFEMGTDVTYLGSGAFEGCTSLASLSMNNALVWIGPSAFADCSSIESVELPDTVMGMGYSAFCNCTALMSITLSDSLMSIPSDAFGNCTSLVTVRFGSCLTEFCSGAFTMCSSLRVMEIPEGVTYVGFGAFHDCTSLGYVSIPDSLLVIDGEAFRGCSALEMFVVSEGNTVFSSVEGVLFDKAKTVLMKCPAKRIGDTYDIPDTVERIDDDAFSGSGLKTMTLPDAVISIGNCAFQRCSSLTEITLGYNIQTIGDYAFSDCISLTTVSIPDSTVSVGEGVFDNCISLREAVIGDGMTEVGGWFFSQCASLTDVYLGSNVEVIGDSAFLGCSALKSITFPKSLVAIGDNAFSGCKVLGSITLGKNVAYVGENAFSSCFSLTSIEVDKGNASLSSEYGVLYDKARTVMLVFPNIQVKEFIMPDTLIAIDGDAYSSVETTGSLIKVEKIVTSKNLVGPYELYFKKGVMMISPDNAESIKGASHTFEFRVVYDNVPKEVKRAANGYDIYLISIDKDITLAEPMTIVLMDKNIEGSMQYRQMYKIDDDGKVTPVKEEKMNKDMIIFYVDSPGYYSMIEYKGGLPNAVGISVGVFIAGTAVAVAYGIINRGKY